ncbi:MAG: electron transfer flavoprotein subunit beta/FixA family protein [Micrococcaceae bacterium]|uniref:electron transfer flavoprotein subunit beta/FixA family protein n=1 Tax=unclassified Arthrobacter TaxID=235627 RepID=UPI002652AD25|nr:electron transfer flavoprotein subunit beta/FixA family protein [Micrococcaceae bacterium]MDN5811925.1 electron transfer flavoprotein subunit beta/FixA family protein [Micrococcaceae bacterium]MDN5825031.1 electron transfer flavoprotein subunit beta/FixA family protein [Micrococcaceae bacterium]MDN5880452.1 electron transfer flavoprotein subunit beta/FixA family protein [Micrococcaceae bacterium]MDN5887966.1 electron transfer flavoprotein subunit beta/FixA family protein [Micrococcaceae bact
MSVTSGAPLKVLVLVKHVPDAQFDRHLTGSDHVIDRSESILSELDEYAVEAALQLVEARGGAKAGHTVTALTMGPERASAAVKKSLQMGATDGVHINDPALAGSDAAATSLVLASAVNHLGGFDVIITGMASTDGETSLVPAQLAERLSLPQLTMVSSLELGEDGVLTARRDSDTTSKTLQAATPALVSVTDQGEEARYPNFKGIMGAKKKKTVALSLSDLGLEASQVGAAGSWTRIEDASPRPPREAGTVVTDSGNAGVELVDFLADKKLL